MKIYVDGGCRHNGTTKAYAAAAAVRITRWKIHWHCERLLGSSEGSTNQRAEITAIILALEMALEKYDELLSSPQLKLTIFSDSKYAVGCMNEWIYKWANNGWKNYRGKDVVNQDLIRKASDLDDKLADLGTVKYVWIPRSENELADKCCNDALDAIKYGAALGDSTMERIFSGSSKRGVGVR